MKMRWQYGTHGIQTHAWVVGARWGPHQTLRSVAIRTADRAAGTHGHLYKSTHTHTTGLPFTTLLVHHNNNHTTTTTTT